MAYVTSREIHLWDYWLILRKRKQIILATLLSLVFIAFLVNTFQTPIYQTFVELVAESNFPTYMPGKEVLQQNQVFDFYTQSKIIRGPSITNKSVSLLEKNLDSLPESVAKLPSDRRRHILTNAVMRSLQTSIMPKTNIFYITAQGRDPKLLAAIANTVSEVYIEEYRSSQQSSSQENIVFLTTKLEELKEKLKTSGIALQSFPAIEKIKGELYETDRKLEEALKIYGKNHPTIIELQTRRASLEQQLSREIVRETDRLQPLTQEMIALKDKSGEVVDTQRLISPETDTFTEEQIRYAMMQREALINEEMYQVLLKKLRETDVSSSILPMSIRILEKAGIPHKPIRPNKKVNLIFGLILGIVMGTGLAFFQEYLDTTLKTQEDIEKYLGLSVLGVIPAVASENETPQEKFNILQYLRSIIAISRTQDIKKHHHRKFHPKASSHHIQHKPDALKRISIKEDLKSPISEAYRALRTSIQFATLNRPAQSFMITSPARGEGKTTTVINLGIIFAQMGKRVLIVDSDFRRPRIHHTFEKRRERGLTSLIATDMKIEDAVLNTDVENLSLLPSGPLPPNPSEILNSEKMKSIIVNLREHYDIILFDSPPLVAVTDAAVLASGSIDGILIVIRAAQTPREVARQGLASLDKVKPKILGAILNNINVEPGSYYYYYYHYDYAYGYGYKEDEARETTTS
jgi:capsular exopolysaccharide synthesis family protein